MNTARSITANAFNIERGNYYSFGMVQPGRISNSPSYRYGFNGMEKDDEVSGSGNSHYTYFRRYDPRLGRWMSMDPVYHVSESPYVAMHNNPIAYNDPNGDCPTCISGAIVGALVELGGILGGKMLLEGMSIGEGLASLTMGDAGSIALGAAGGAVTGLFDGGGSALVKFATSPNGRKITKFIVEKGVDFIVGLIQESIDGDLTKEDVDSVLRDLGIESLIGHFNPQKRVDIVDDRIVKNAQSQFDRAEDLLKRAQKSSDLIDTKRVRNYNAAKKYLKQTNRLDNAGKIITGTATKSTSNAVKAKVKERKKSGKISF